MGAITPIFRVTRKTGACGMEKQSKNSPVGRRQALARLGLGVAVAYTAPTVLHLDRSAEMTFSP